MVLGRTVNVLNEQSPVSSLLLCLHLPPNNLLILLIILDKHRRPLPLQSIRVHYKRHEKRRRLRRTCIHTDPVVTPWSLVPGPALVDSPQRIIIHLDQNRPMQDVSSDRGAPVAVRGSRAVRRIFNEHADDGFAGAVYQAVLVDDGSCW